MNKFVNVEDYQTGQSGTTVGRTVTTADIVGFGGLTGDYHPHHMDRHYMASSIYGVRVAHGLLGCSLGVGLLSQHAPHTLGRGVPGAYFYGCSIDYQGAIKLDDTIRVRWKVIEKSEAPGSEDFGQVRTAFELVNQDGVSPYGGSVCTLVRKKAAKDAKLMLKSHVPWQLEEFISDPDKQYYVEDFPVGKGGVSGGRTITETDIVQFASLTGEYDPRHVDAEFARHDMFGERIAQGLLVFSVGFPLAMFQYRHLNRPESGFAGHLNDTVTFVRPVRIGDTIRCQYRVASTRASKSKPQVGLITYEFQVLNQRNEVVQLASVILMERTKAGQST
ncbi:MAG: MaoC/PaaZ C-terminal domain-containing protein [Dehalococcoidia bacterium]|nr:MaoC/PaaZ C-terminal domain-containing protein [Dehalococcoidia bacterium]